MELVWLLATSQDGGFGGPGAKDKTDDAPACCRKLGRWRWCGCQGVAGGRRFGADLEAKDKDVDFPLHRAALAGGGAAAGEVAGRRRARADLKAKAKDGQTPLHVAADFGQVEVVRLLVAG